MTESTLVPTSGQSSTVTVTATGRIQLKAEVPVGSTVKSAFKKVNPEMAFDSFSYRDDNGKPVSLDRKVTTNLNVVVIDKVQGG